MAESRVVFACVWSCIVLTCAIACDAPRERRPRNAVLVIMDTMRRDRATVYGHDRSTTPALASLAAEGVVFDAAVSNSSWTLPATVGLLTGDYPSRRSYERGLQRSLVRRLQEAGFRTAAFTEGVFVSAAYGVDLGFDSFAERRGFRKKVGAQQGTAVVAETFSAASRWIESSGDAPFFLLVHTYEVHTPYHREDFTAGLTSGKLGPRFEVFHGGMFKKGLLRATPDELRYVRALYDGGVAAADRHLGELLDTLERSGRASDTLVVVTADHGEDLGERTPAWPGNHGHTLYDEQLLVPLVLRDPSHEWPRRRVETQVRTIDVMPTVLDRLGVALGEGVEGRSLVPLMEGAEQGDRIAFSRVSSSRPGWNLRPRLALRDGRHKLIVSSPEAEDGASPEVELYDLTTDPAETDDLAARRPQLVRKLEGRLREVAAKANRGGRPNYNRQPRAAESEQVRDQLRALGYLE